jgi:26S proteasome regulatory subunit N3
VHHSAARQAVLINLILRAYFLKGLVDQAAKFVAKVTFPETRSNAEFARYLYYLGLIRAVQLQYTESHACLMQAVRKAPQGCALGFRLAATKAAVIVELLTGEIPDRAVFNEFKASMKPYLAITQAVRKGDVAGFSAILAKDETLFVKDRLWSLIRRLHQNVIKAGLKSITTSYSRIAMADVANKLSLASVEEAVDVTAKAIVDGVIEATINYDKGHLESSWGQDVYSTSEPSKQLHKRIAFCLQLHTDAVKAMMYPDVNEIEKELMETNEEILRAQKMDLEDLDQDDDDLMM